MVKWMFLEEGVGVGDYQTRHITIVQSFSLARKQTQAALIFSFVFWLLAVQIYMNQIFFLD